MAPKNPIGKIADTAISSLKHPVGTAGKVIGQAKGTAALGITVAEQVGRTALAVAGEAAGAVARRRQPGAPRPSGASQPSSSVPLRPVPDVNEAAHTVTPSSPAKQAAAQAAPTTPPTKKATGRKPAAKKAAAPAAKQTAPAKNAAKKTPAKKAPAAGGTPTPADVAKRTTKKPPAKKAGPGTPSGQLPPRGRTAEELRDTQGADVPTPVGTTAAGEARNPDTAEQDLNQPGTEGLLEESTAHEVASKSDQLRKAAEQNPE